MKVKKPETQCTKDNNFTSGSLPRAMFLFSLPHMLGILLQNLYGAVDLFVVGHYGSTADISAVTIGSQLMSSSTQLIIGFATGVTILTGLYYGANNKKELSRLTGTAIFLFGMAAIIITGLFLGFHELLITIMQTPQQAFQATKAYLLICAFGIPFIIGYNVVTSILTGLGDSKTPFLFIAIACVINIVLDVILVKYAQLGAMGAAIATTSAQAGSFLFSILFLKYKGLDFTLSLSDIKPDKNQIGQIVRIGGPVAVQNVLVNASFLFITAVINTMGLVASAAAGIVEKLIIFLFVPAISMSTAVGTASSQNIGAQKYDRARQSLGYGIVMALIPSFFIAVFCQFGGSLLASILTQDAEVINMASDYLRSYIWDIILVSFVFSMNGYFNSCGKSWFSMLHSIVTTFAIRVPLAYFLRKISGTSLFLIGWAAPASTFVSLILCGIFLMKIRKREQLDSTS